MRTIVARDLMTPEILGVDESWTVQEATQYLVDHAISGAVVRNESGEIAGVLSLTDIASNSADGGSRVGIDRSQPGFYASGWDEQVDPSDLARMHFTDSGCTVGEVMTPDVFSVDADAPVSEIATTMLGAHIHRLLVTEDGEFVGLISTSDLLGLLVQD